MALAADEQYLWIQNETRQDGPCAIARMKHGKYFVRGNVFYDANQNGHRDSKEFGYGDITLKALPSGLMIYPDIEGNFAFSGEEGEDYLIEVMEPEKFVSIKKNSGQTILGVKLKTEIPDVVPAVWLPRSRCNTNRDADIRLENRGVSTAQKIVVKLIPEKMRLVQNGTEVDTAVFVYDSLAARQTVNLQYNIKWPDAEETGNTAKLYVQTNIYSDDVLAVTKMDSIETVIRCSYDPNDISVTPAGVGPDYLTLKKSTLQYQIRFENTGNDTAYHVTIYDTLSTHLDMSTFRLLSASHTVNAELTPEGVAKFHFNNIMLPDTNTDKKNAQGYVRFSVRPLSNIAESTSICNKAGIVFDENKAIITNEVCNTMVTSLPVILLGFGAENNVQKTDLYPNPATEWLMIPAGVKEYTVYSVLGNEILKSEADKLNVSPLDEGVYIIKMKGNDGKVITRKFSVIK